MDRTRLIYKGISGIVGTDKVCLVVLTDESESRQITIVCDSNTEFQLGIRTGKTVQTDRLLPEILLKLIDVSVKTSLEMVIDDIVDGQYSVSLHNILTGATMSIRASDAVLLSYISDIPLYIEKEMMYRQSVAYRKNAGDMPLPINTISNDMLDKAMQKAINDENYELASLLRDERQRRMNDNENKSR